ncbi:MAG TPA: TIGR00725 family protein, partial [Thermoleophilia bacterium]|nr:TIGR00725 family protein [Thermoleophilia bacterium]
MPDIYVSVIGGSRCDDRQTAHAEEVGRLLAEAGCVVVCGGMDGGVMAAVARGARRGGGRSIGLLPDLDRRH